MACRHQQNGAVIARSSQPMIGVLYWRSQEGENFLKTLSEACLPPAESTDQVKKERKGKGRMRGGGREGM